MTTAGTDPQSLVGKAQDRVNWRTYARNTACDVEMEGQVASDEKIWRNKKSLTDMSCP